MNAAFLATCAGEMATTSQKIAQYAAVFSIGIALVLTFRSLRQRSFSWVPLYGSVLLLHPAWIMNVDRGDCGASMRFLSVAATLTLLAMALSQIFWPHVNRQRFIFGLCLISWAAYLINWPLDSILSHLELMPGPGAGFATQAAFSFVAAEKDLLLVALALTFVCFSDGLINRLRHRRRAGQPSRQNAGVDQDTRGAESRSSSSSTLCLRIVFVLPALLLLLTLIFLGSLSPAFLFGANPVFSILALAWSILLIISAVRGKFPGGTYLRP